MKASKDLSQNSKNLKQIIDSWHKATVPGNMVQPFHQAGFYKQEQADGTFLVRAAVEKARAVRGIEHVECKDEFLF